MQSVIGDRFAHLPTDCGDVCERSLENRRYFMFAINKRLALSGKSDFETVALPLMFCEGRLKACCGHAVDEQTFNIINELSYELIK